MSSDSRITWLGVLIAGAVMVVLGVTVIWSGSNEDRTLSDLRDRGVQATAVVTRIEVGQQSGAADRTSTLHVEFRDQNGQPARAQFLTDRKDMPRVSDQIPIVYDPQDPSHATGNLPLGTGPQAPVWLGWLVGAGGVVFVVRGLWMRSQEL